MVDQGLVDSLNSAARRAGLGVGAAKAYRNLLKLDPAVQQIIVEGQARGLSLARLYKLARIPDAQRQQSELERLLCSTGAGATPTKRPAAAAQRAAKKQADEITIRLKAALSFNPELFVDQLRHAQQQLHEVQTYVRTLNAQLARPRSRRTPHDIEVDLGTMLRRRSSVEHYRVSASPPRASLRARGLRARVLDDLHLAQ